MILASRRYSLALSLVMLSCYAGCGSVESLPPLAPVVGKVLLKDQPVEGASITFDPGKGPSSIAITPADGTFKLALNGGQAGAVIGTHTVRVVVQGQPVSNTKAKGAEGEMLPPVTYQFPEGIQVQEGTNEIELRLDKARRL